MPEFIGEEVDTEEVEEGGEDLIDNPHDVGGFLVEFVSELVECV